MRVRYQNRLNLAVGDCLEQRQRIFASVFRMHSAVEQEPVRANLHIVRIRADLCVACEINEFQVSESVKALKRSRQKLRLHFRGGSASPKTIATPSKALNDRSDPRGPRRIPANALRTTRSAITTPPKSAANFRAVFFRSGRR